MKNFGKFMTIVLTMIIEPIINGFVVMKLWLWLVVPTFEVDPLRLIEIIGLLILINYIRTKPNKDITPDNFWSEFVFNVIYLIIMSGLALFSGWIVQMYI